MKIDRLLCFQFASEFSSFSKAADNLYLSQSSLSKNIRALEEELGGDLFIRKNNNTIELSPFGEYMSSYINNLISDYNILVSAADNYRINRLKRLSIATSLNVAHNGILAPLTEYESSQESFYIETREKEHSILRQEMEMRHVDVCFGYQELLRNVADYCIFPLFSDPLLLITTKDEASRRNWRKPLDICTLHSVQFCFPREDMEIFTFLNNVCRNNGFIPQLTHSDVRLGTIRQYISAGMRCTLQFKSIAYSKFHGDQFTFIELENSPTLTYAMYVENTQSKQTKTSFVNYMLHWFGGERSSPPSASAI